MFFTIDVQVLIQRIGCSKHMPGLFTALLAVAYSHIAVELLDTQGYTAAEAGTLVRI